MGNAFSPALNRGFESREKSKLIRKGRYSVGGGHARIILNYGELRKRGKSSKTNKGVKEVNKREKVKLFGGWGGVEREYICCHYVKYSNLKSKQTAKT